MGISTTHKLLTGLWTADVEAMESSIEHFRSGRTVTNDCQVAFFEVARDTHLHVNVTHKRRTKTSVGWAGPGSLPGGFVHNRTFRDPQPTAIVGHIRKMVFADLA
jgi:hypothetical protein